ncbi:MAG: alpha/beta fold hydrolase, partial [Chloroflexi bacterium]|nr:alpha/beta fold hydrolase [Chloroflexota bacterium]
MEIDLELYRREVRVSVRPHVRLAVIDVAPEQPGRIFLFLHGFGGQAMQWQYQLRHFSRNNRVIALDLRGHGRSDKSGEDYQMPTLLSDVEIVLQALGVNTPVTLVGHSFGGAIACEFAYAHPTKVERLILAASAGEYHLNSLYRLALGLPRAALQAIQPFLRRQLGAPAVVLKSLYEGSLSHWVGWSLFRSLTVPTLVIRGHHDRVFQQSFFDEVARAIPNAEEVDVGASGHMVMLERRDAVNRAISRFLEAGVQSWRAAQDVKKTGEGGDLLQERPWLPHYDQDVPQTIAVPRVPVPQLLRSAARRFPLRAALRFAGSNLTYLRLNREANRFANALRSLGIEKGDRVMLLLPNLPQMVVAFYGTLRAGAVAVFSLPTHEPEELARQAQDCGARLLVTLTRFDDLTQHILAHLGEQRGHTLQHILFTHAGDYLPWFSRMALQLSPKRRQVHKLDIPMQPGMHRYERLVYSQRPDAPDVPISPNDLAVIIYTGGTTDLPKGVMLSHRNLVANAIQTRHWIPEAKEGRERFLCVLPFAHSYGLTTALNVPIALGATLILKPTFEVSDILKTIRRERPTIFPGVPQMYVAIKDFPGVRKYRISSIKACISGSAPLPVEVQEAFEKLTRGRLVEGYGLTEAGPVTHANPLNGQRKVGSIGVPFPSTQARVVDLRQGK